MYGSFSDTSSRTGLWVFSASSGELVKQLSIQSALYAYAWSPNALVLAYAMPAHINIWRLGNENSLVCQPQHCMGMEPCIFWAPNGRHLALVCPYNWQRTWAPISIISTAGSVVWTGQTSLPPNTAAHPDAWESPWSADGSTCLVRETDPCGDAYTVVWVDRHLVRSIRVYGITPGSLSPCGDVLVGLTSCGTAARGA